MWMPDVNVLVYAHRRDERVHDAYREWLEERVNGREPLALSALATVAFVRVVTHRKIFDDPTPLSIALAQMDALIEHPNCRLLAPTQRHWHLVKSLCTAANATGKLIADAQHAAVAVEHGCEWVTRDRDVRRFEEAGLRWTHLELE